MKKIKIKNKTYQDIDVSSHTVNVPEVVGHRHHLNGLLSCLHGDDDKGHGTGSPGTHVHCGEVSSPVCRQAADSSCLH